MGETRSRGCARTCGCGCAIVAALFVLALIGVAAYGWTQQPGPADDREERLVAEIPGDPQPSPEAGDPTVTIERADAATHGTIRLDLSHGIFTVRPAMPGEQPHVEAIYDAATHAVVEEASETSTGWLWNVQVTPRQSLLGQLFGDSRRDANVTVVLPRDRPFDLEIDSGMGIFDTELGGLRLRSLDVTGSMGQRSLSFSEPTPEPVRSITIDTRIGESRLTQLGNAAPARLEIDSSLGEMQLDLGGAWQGGADSDVAIRFKMGRLTVRIPADVPIESLDAQVDGGEVRVDDALETGTSPGLRISIEGTAAEAQVGP